MPVEPCKNMPGYGPTPLEPGDTIDPTFLPPAAAASFAALTGVPGDNPALSTALSGKSDTSHTHGGVYQPVGSYAAAAHTHAPADITGTAVITTDPRLSDSRAPTVHAHAWADITSGKPTTVTGYGITDAALAPIATLVVPLTGQTRTFNTSKQWEIIACNHTATIAAQTFVFPVDANAAIGQELRIFSRSIITTVTLTLNSNTILGLALTTLPANGNVAWRKVSASTWARIQ